VLVIKTSVVRFASSVKVGCVKSSLSLAIRLYSNISEKCSQAFRLIDDSIIETVQRCGSMVSFYHLIGVTNNMESICF